MKGKDIYEKALNKWGEDSQLDKTKEELGELIEAINDYQTITRIRKLTNEITNQESDLFIDHIIEEATDCRIMISQLQVKFPGDRWKRWLTFKIERLINLVNKIDASG
jgi:NTP pyrophosphatase (non-canonical NTP hydrolase)